MHNVQRPAEARTTNGGVRGQAPPAGDGPPDTRSPMLHIHPRSWKNLDQAASLERSVRPERPIYKSVDGGRSRFLVKPLYVQVRLFIETARIGELGDNA